MGNVNVASAVDAGPIKVIAFVPLSESSKNLINPGPVLPFFTDIPSVPSTVRLVKLPDAPANAESLLMSW